MQPENDTGNIEYKLYLKNDAEEKLQKLATQMRFRCEESESSECFYNIGVSDNGDIVGITEEEYNQTINILNKVADKNNYSVTLITSTPVDKTKNIYEVLIREKNEDKYIDIKVCVAGSVDAGKSSIIGSLVTGEKDDGRGLTRSSVFNYVHELKTGRTSSIAHHILGFDYNGNVVNNQSLTKLSWMDIVNKSSKIISLFDLAGHEKYLKTTILGISSSFPDICIIMISANNGISVMTKEHIVLCITLKVPFIIIISKIDICKDRKNVLDETVSSVNKILKHPVVRRIPLNVRTTEDILLSVKNIYNFNMTPIFYTSCVTGEGMDHLKQFLNLVGKNNNNAIKKNNDNKIEFHIDHIYNVLGVGIVLGGNLVNGNVKIGDKLLMGPGTNGEYENVLIKSIYCKKISLQNVSNGSYVCFGIKKIDKKLIKRGNVIISNNNDKLSVKKFIAKITILRTHSTSIKVGYEPLFHAYSIRKVVKIMEINNKQNAKNCVVDDNILRSNDTANVTFEFKHDPQYLKVGTRFIISEGKCKICGEVLELI